jgi:hypothetical protein
MTSVDTGFVDATNLTAAATATEPSFRSRLVSGVEQLANALNLIEKRLGNLEDMVAKMRLAMTERQAEKEWYSTAELAKLLDKSDFTVREKWCNQGRIECEKDPDSGKWRIPASEVCRLRNAGGLRPRQPR